MTNSEELLAQEEHRPDPKDQAELIVTVYRKLGLFSLRQAERAPEEITRDIERLYTEHPDGGLEPFYAINIDSLNDFQRLLVRFDGSSMD